jgi:hypothetical protein
MVIMLAIQYFCWSVGVYGFVIWLPSMLKAAGETSIVLAVTNCSISSFRPPRH